MFFALYKPMHYHITLDKKEFNPNFYDYEKAIVLYYYVKELKPTAFFAFFPKWVNSIYANGVPAYYKKYYPYTIPVNVEKNISINISALNCTSVLLFDSHFKPVFYNYSNNNITFSAKRGTYYLYCLDIEQNLYNTSIQPEEEYKIDLQKQKILVKPLFYVCFNPTMKMGELILETQTRIGPKYNCALNNIVVTNNIDLPNGENLGFESQLKYEFYELFVK